MKHLFKTIQKSDWGYLLDFVSPAFFEIIPPFGLAKEIKNLMATRFLSNKSASPAIHFQFEGVQLKSLPDNLGLKLNQVADLKPAQKKKMGELILALYFHQIFHFEEFYLDFRPARFFVTKKSKTLTLNWQPKNLMVKWDLDFQCALRNVYTGFYEDDADLFEDGLETLNLMELKDLFLNHFGEGDQTSVSFHTQHFLETFHDIFTTCKEQKIKLSPFFLHLGVALATMYECLECLDVELDVRQAYEWGVHGETA